MRILLTGKNGQLGWELHQQLAKDFTVFAIGREDIDFLDTKFFADMLRQALTLYDSHTMPAIYRGKLAGKNLY